jgi:hypothetical protein
MLSLESAMPASAHPFALLLSPKEVCDAVARSERLSGLRRRVCRPLDKPMIPLRSPAALVQTVERIGD